MKFVFVVLAICALTVHAQTETAAPPSSDADTVVAVARSNGLTSLVEAITADDLDGVLGNASVPLAYTVFAPTNEAIEALLADQDTTIAALQESGELDDILQYHILTEPFTAAQLATAGSADTNFRNQTLSFEQGSDGSITIIAAQSNATIVTSDVPAGQTLVHVIDGVLVPDFTAPLTPTASS